MDLKNLKEYLQSLAQGLRTEEKQVLDARVKALISVFPFNEYEYALMFLLDSGAIDFEGYEKLRANYVSANRYLDLYGLAPRVFGEIWGHKHIMDLDPQFIRPNRSIDPGYDGEYDLWINNIKVEAKAARGINTKKRGDLASRALRYGSSEPFWMNFQQIKVDSADVFIFVGVWVDRIVYWVLAKDEIKANRYLSHQHRGGVEYQIGITHKNIRDFDIFLVDATGIARKALEKGGNIQRQGT